MSLTLYLSIGNMKDFKITQLDHLVLTVKDIETTITFYTKVLGMKMVTFGKNRKALKFGSQKINLHQYGNEFEPRAKQPTPGSADLCFITDTPIDKVISHLQQHDITIKEGPMERTGADLPLLSVYIRDPDGNLLEIANQI